MLYIKHCLWLSFDSTDLLYSRAWLQIFCCTGHQTIQHNEKNIRKEVTSFCLSVVHLSCTWLEQSGAAFGMNTCVLYWTKNIYFCKQNIKAYIREILSLIQSFISRILQPFFFDSAAIFQLLVGLIKPFAAGTKPQIFSFLKKVIIRQHKN